jgi:hypothetical protein
VNTIDRAITALARHYGVPEAEIAGDHADLVDEDGHRIDLADLPEGEGYRILLENVTHSLIAALWTLNSYGFDDEAVTAAEELAAEFDLP